jgi:hypothetical protein
MDSEEGEGEDRDRKAPPRARFQACSPKPIHTCRIFRSRGAGEVKSRAGAPEAASLTSRLALRSPRMSRRMYPVHCKLKLAGPRLLTAALARLP